MIFSDTFSVISRGSSKISNAFVCLLIGSAVAVEIVAVQLMDVLASFYSSVSSEDSEMFVHTLLRAFVITTLISMFKSILQYSTESTALEWRKGGIPTSSFSSKKERFGSANYEHTIFDDVMLSTTTDDILDQMESYGARKLSSTSHSGCSSVGSDDAIGENTSSIKFEQPSIIENVDQRVTQDVDKLCTQSATLLSTVVITPGLIVFYMCYLWRLFGWVAPTACVVYFILSAIVTTILTKSLAALIYRQEKLEGYFRLNHMLYRIYIESIALLKASSYEDSRLQGSFKEVYDNQKRTINVRFPLYLATNWFSYFGAIINYSIVGVSILYMSQYDTGGNGVTDTSSDRASLMARGSYACLYLVNAFTTILGSAEVVTEVLGYTRRISELVSTCKRCRCLHGSGNDIVALESTQELYCDNSVRDNSSSVEWDCVVKPVDSRPYIFIENKVKSDMGMEESIVELKNIHIYAPGSESQLKISGTKTMVEQRSPEELQQHLILSNFSLRVARGSRLLISGDSGCGKSTLIKFLCGLVACKNIRGGASCAGGYSDMNDRLGAGRILQSGDSVTEEEKCVCMSSSSCDMEVLSNCAVEYSNIKRYCGRADEQTVANMYCSRDDVMCLPQIPFCFYGSLASNLIYSLYITDCFSECECEVCRDAIDDRVHIPPQSDGHSKIVPNHGQFAYSPLHASPALLNCESIPKICKHSKKSQMATDMLALHPTLVDDMVGILDSVNLRYLLASDGRHSASSKDESYQQLTKYECDWGRRLTVGEKQRLSVARLLLFARMCSLEIEVNSEGSVQNHRVRLPSLILLDECTSAVDMTMEGKLYELISACFTPAAAAVSATKSPLTKCSVISVGHRDTLRKFHDIELKLK